MTSYFLPAKAMQSNLHKFEELVFCDLWFPDSGFRFRIPDSGFRFRIPDSGFRFPVSGFRVLGLPRVFDQMWDRNGSLTFWRVKKNISRKKSHQVSMLTIGYLWEEYEHGHSLLITTFKRFTNRFDVGIHFYLLCIFIFHF